MRFRTFGPLGIGVVLFVLRIIVPTKAVDKALTAARTDLTAENQRLIAEKPGPRNSATRH